MKGLFSCKDYKEYLLATEKSSPARAFRSQLAAAASCQKPYVSQVLNGTQHFSLEQADGISALLQHTAEERSYFLLLVQLARAGTSSLRQFFSEQIKVTRERHLTLKTRVNTGESLNESDQITYYSEWYYSAIHVLVTVEKFRSYETIAKRLGLPIPTVKKVCDFLLNVGLLSRKKDLFVTGQKRLYLSGDSPLISRHHSNWRLHALQSLANAGVEDLHYSSVVTISEEDSEKIRELLIESIQKAKETIRASKEEDIFSFSVDFYRL